MADARDPVLDLLRRLSALARTVAERAGFPGDALRRDDRLVIDLAVPTDPGDDEGLAREARDLERRLEEAVRDALEARGATGGGRAYCLRCGTDDCPHARPRSPREVFAGYGATGTPRFVDFTQLLLDCQDPRVELLFDESRRTLVSLVLSGAELTRDVLPAYRDQRRDFRLHAQLVAGWFRARDESGHPHPVALTFQVCSTRRRRGPRRFSLAVVGVGPDGRPPDRLQDLLVGDSHVRELRWARSVLERIESSAGRRGSVERRIEGLLDGLGRRLERGHRARGRRTRHAEERHLSGERPTRMAIADLQRADGDSLLYDTRRRTVVVLGERGRAHVFSDEGRLVTSVRYPPHVIERRRRSGLWRPLTGEEVRSLRARWPLGGTPAPPDPGGETGVGTDSSEP
ncbi:MAG: hypothetical protein D6738_14360 [Acidobacteria bacterium]|nr:MAG: hypothetical protein D6738_14360 [Acidobacteriota bacterium]